MPKPSVPIELAKSLKKRGVSWKEVALELKKRGFPPDPYLPFYGDSVWMAIKRSGRK